MNPVRAVVLEPGILDRLHAHAATAKAGWEVGGALILEQRMGNTFAVEYRPARNLARRPGFFRAASFPFELPYRRWALQLHSHPDDAIAAPSVGDLLEAIDHGDELLAIFNLGELHVWRVLARGGVAGRSTDAAPLDAYARVPVVLIRSYRAAVCRQGRGDRASP